MKRDEVPGPADVLVEPDAIDETDDTAYASAALGY